QKFGPEAAAFAKQRLKQGQTVTLEKGNPQRDQYGRLLGYLWINDENFNKSMIEKGYARVAYVFPPNTKYVDEFREAEHKAKDSGRSEEHTSELQSRFDLVCRLLLETKK